MPVGPTQRRRSGPKAALLAALLALVGPAVAGDPGPQDRLFCPDTRWGVTGGTQDERQLACSGIDRAAAFLQGCGLHLTAAPRVRLLDAPPLHCGVPVHGLYDGSRDDIALGRPPVCAARATQGSLYQLLPAPLAFLSVAGHEATHALLVAGGLGGDRRTEHEYIAAVVQFALLPAEARALLLDGLDIGDGVGIWQLNALAHALQPLRFAGLAWRHFAAEPDGCALIRAMAEGTLRLPDFSAF